MPKRFELRRLLLLSAVFAGTAALGGVAACGGDDSGGGDNTSDASTTSDVGSGFDSGGGGGGDSGGSDVSTDTNPAPATHAVALDVSVWLGQIAQLDASSSTATPATTITYAWTVESAPAGSTITTASLQNASSAKPSFVPDVDGNYSLKVTATANGVPDSKTVTVKAFVAPVIYLRDDVDSGVASSALHVAASNGKGVDTILNCPLVSDAAQQVSQMDLRVAEGGADWWEGPPGGDPKIAFTFDSAESDGATVTYLAAANASSTCTGNAPRRLDVLPNGIGGAGGPRAYQPRFSPNGNRIAYARNDGSNFYLATVGFDGSTPHQHVAAYAALADGGPLPDAGPNVTNAIPPRWVNDTTLAWLQTTGGGSWQIMTANDADDATPTVFMTCTGTGSPQEFDLLGDGSAIVSVNVPLPDASNGAIDLWVYRPDATTKACTVVRNLTNLPAQGSVAQDFSLSPDKKRVAFLRFDNTTDAGGPGYAAFTAPVDGTSLPALVPGAPAYGGVNGEGPRWIAGGAAVSWGQTATSFDAGVGTVGTAVVVSSQATGLRAVATSTDSSSTIYAIGNFCSVGWGAGSSATAVGSIAALLALVVRRRRRRDD